ncbi:hypothetical protein AAFF_G00254860 [Aldrovandia affinis]|uniref:Hexosyltransferase n=1 Tax=Aldrovandia affinis TaxID=143900 RepID=A0AAD7RCA2_9TELE|nr:hypothetical protein AAFF_G00254860 [Aldrovandia affinis]
MMKSSRIPEKTVKRGWKACARCLLGAGFLLCCGLLLVGYVGGDSWWATLRGGAWWSQRLGGGKAKLAPLGPASSVPWRRPGPFEVRYPHRYRWILDEPEKCAGHGPFLVLMVPVAPWDRGARDAIRASWGNETLVPGVVIRRLFLLGLPWAGLEAELQGEIRRESQEHGDLLQGDFLDSYRNLTIKTMLMMEWLVQRCPTAAYAAKVDTDMFLNLELLIRLLGPDPAPRKRSYITGALIIGGMVRRDKGSKWYMPPEVYPKPTYPLYISGNAYVFSMDLPRRILEASRQVRPVHLEDVYLGMCLEHLGLRPSPPPQPGLFSLRPLPYSRCLFSRIVSVTGLRPGQLLTYWADFHQAGQPCPP